MDMLAIFGLQIFLSLVLYSLLAKWFLAPWLKGMTQRQGRLPEFLVTHLKAVADDHKNGVFSAQTDVVERIGGQAPQSLEEFVREHRESFTGKLESKETAQD